MKRSRAGTPGLKHVSFFEALAETEEHTPAGRSAVAGLLTLRLVDHWVLAGPVMVEPESVSVRSVREAIMKLAPNDAAREVLLGTVNTMQVVREVDLQPVLPRIFAYAQILERRGELKLAADAFETVVRFCDEEYDGDLLMDSHMRLGYCLRNLGQLDEAEREYSVAGKLGQRRRELARVLRSETGLAMVAMMRGNLPKADEMLAAICDRSQEAELNEELAFGLQTRSMVAQRRGDVARAVCLAYDALKYMAQPIERDRILGNLGACFILMERYDAARDALTILEATAATEITRADARVNLVALAARSGDRDSFERWHRSLADAELTTEARVNFLIESARGLRRFGTSVKASRLVRQARDLARQHGLNHLAFEAERLFEAPIEVRTEKTRGEIPISAGNPAASVELELRRMAAALAA